MAKKNCISFPCVNDNEDAISVIQISYVLDLWPMLMKNPLKLKYSLGYMWRKQKQHSGRKVAHQSLSIMGKVDILCLCKTYIKLTGNVTLRTYMCEN